MRRAGLNLLTGTDAKGPFPALIPGISLDEELSDPRVQRVVWQGRHSGQRQPRS